MQQSEHVSGLVIEHFARAAQRRDARIRQALLRPEFRKVTAQTVHTNAVLSVAQPEDIVQIPGEQILHRDAQIHHGIVRNALDQNRIQNPVGVILRVVTVAAQPHRYDSREWFSGRVKLQGQRLFDARGQLKEDFRIVAQVFEHLLFLRTHLAQRLKHDRASRRRRSDMRRHAILFEALRRLVKGEQPLAFFGRLLAQKPFLVIRRHTFVNAALDGIAIRINNRFCRK